MKTHIPKNMGELLEKAAAEHKNKTVIHFHHEDETISFEGLDKKVNQYANALQKQGIQKGDHVAVMLSNCPEFPCTWLALAKLGAVMIPLNNGYQSKDLEYILNDSNACVLIIEDIFAQRFRETKSKAPDVHKVFIVGECQDDLGDLLTDLTAEESDQFQATDVSFRDLVNIQYTSGTTGMPKGCMLTHEYWLLCGACAATQLRQEDIFLTVTPFYYMDPQWQLIMTLTAGSTLVMTKKYSASQPESEYDKNHNMRFMFVGAFPPGLQHQFEERFNMKLRETFGMTEIGPGMMVPVEDDHMTGSGSVGKIMAFRQAKIVDDQGIEVNRGEVGELLICGRGIFKGYYRKPDATAAAFDGDWFKTGDLFRQDAKGYYYIVGRIKDMIRRSGENISAREVEDILKSHPEIKNAAVVPVPDESRGEEVKAYIIPLDGEGRGSLFPEKIIEYCIARIANFKVPRYIEYCQSFPQTPTGKIQKHILVQGKEDLSSGCFDRMDKK